jgi:uncharacterized 2Fe-2S/4Fe-4S cluster protein (DUF4445 family)
LESALKFNISKPPGALAKTGLVKYNTMEKFRVIFQPDDKTVEVEKDRTILSAALSAGVYINSTCGGDGVCGRCKVIVRQGKVSSLATGLISPEEKKKGIHLACLTQVLSDIEVEILAESRIDFEKVSLQEIQTKLKGISLEAEEVQCVEEQVKKFTHQPLTQKIYLELPKPSPNDNISDLDRIIRQLSKTGDISSLQVGLGNVRLLGELLRVTEWKVTVTLSKRNKITEILLIEPNDTSSRNYGVAFDIGTTTISGQLVDLNSEKILGTKATYNKQAAFGADVITRIIYAEKEEGLEKLHAACVSCMNEIITDLVREHGIDLNDLTCVMCAGNTTMIHLLLRIDPSYIRRQPYVPTANFITTMRCAEVGININPRGLLACVPGIASYVGGDVTAGVLSSGQDKKTTLSILIDIGTNGEIVLGNEEFLIATSASAGPAFEGSGVGSGMRSSSGAIQKLTIDKDFKVNFETIGNTKPRGICGSGYIDIIAEMLKAGILDKDGKIKSIKHKRIRENELGKEFVLVFKEESGSSADIVINEADIDNLKRAKAAIYSATCILNKHLSVKLEQVENIFIAGGFGTSLNITNAIQIGLLPDVERSKFKFVGNSSLAGARQILLSGEALNKSVEIARKMTYFDLSTDPVYMDEYVAALFFPHTDLSKFPNVKLHNI